MPLTSRMGAAEDALHAALLVRKAIGGNPLENIPVDLGHPGDRLQHEHVWITENAEASQEWQTTIGTDGQKYEQMELTVMCWADIGGTYKEARDRALLLAGEVETAVRNDFRLGTVAFQAEVARMRKMAAVGETGRPIQVEVDVQVTELLGP